jgi:hypothetical protein
MDSEALLCHRCGCSLHPGEGDLYVVRIEALADPYPPKLDGSLLEADFEEEYNRLLERMREMSESELMDQVYRRLTIHLCGRCYRQWIEDPAGRPVPPEPQQ